MPARTCAVEQLREADANLLFARCLVSVHMIVFVCLFVCVCVCVVPRAGKGDLIVWPTGCSSEHVFKFIVCTLTFTCVCTVVHVAWQRGVGKDARPIQGPRKYCPG